MSASSRPQWSTTHAHDRPTTGSRRRPQSRAAGPRRPRTPPGGLGADLRRQPVPGPAAARRRVEHATWQGAFEIVAVTATLSQDGSHLHLAVADHQGRTVGGHLAEGCTVRTTAEVVLAADDRWWSANPTREARDRHPVLAARGSFDPGSNRLVVARVRETTVGLTDSRSKTHPEFRPAGATCCHSLLLAGRAILDADLREWLFLLVTA
jgi:hypothetical protein